MAFSTGSPHQLLKEAVPSNVNLKRLRALMQQQVPHHCDRLSLVMELMPLLVLRRPSLHSNARVHRTLFPPPRFLLAAQGTPRRANNILPLQTEVVLQQAFFHEQLLQEEAVAQLDVMGLLCVARFLLFRTTMEALSTAVVSLMLDVLLQP